MKIQSTRSIQDRGLKILIFGESGVGKTTLARTIKEPVLVISAEGGLLPLHENDIQYIDITRDDDNKPINKTKRFDRLREVFVYLNTEECRKTYKVIYIDSLTEISQCVFDMLKEKYPDKADSLKLYGDLAETMRSTVKASALYGC